MDIEQLLSNKTLHKTSSEPILFDLAREEDRKTLQDITLKNPIRHISDNLENQLEEYFQVEHPELVYTPGYADELERYLREIKGNMPLWQHGRWVYYPWHSTLVHVLTEEAFLKVRTARNKYLINAEEQATYYNATIGLAGLSVGNSVALAIVLQGGGKHWRIADHDTLALSNTNRIRTSIEYIGLTKAEMTARQIYEINPYATVELFPDGITEDTIDAFFEGPPKLDIVLDEIDNLAAKYLIRQRAQKHHLAVVMAADNGDNGVVDIERYDEDPNTPFFHGRMGDITYESLSKLDKFGIGKMITQLVGPENVTERMQQSLLQMGKTIVSWPQLGGAALLNGSAVAYCVRKILNHQPLESNRAILSLDEKLTPDWHSPDNIKKRAAVTEDFKKIFGL